MKKLPSPSKAAAIFITLISLIFLCSVGYLLFFSHGSDQGYVAEIYQNGVLIKTIPLDQVTEEQRFTISGENGAENVITVRPGSIAVTAASCPDKICVHQGFRSNSLLPITCLPNHLVIRLRKSHGDEAADAVTY